MADQTPLPDRQPNRPSVVGERERERVVRDLGDHFAQDHLSLEEYEFRVQAALHATQWFQLVATTNDLPTLDFSRPLLDGESASEEGSPGRVRTVLAVMAGVVRRGSWLVPRRIRALACMGGIQLDLRDATFSAAVTEIYALAIMGGVEITVPPGVRLEVDGLAIMGGFEDQAGFPAIAGHDAPIVRVTGLALMGGVVTKMKPRGWNVEDAKDA
ncbi:MAG: DUF1707 domain-containing protein [Gemmatimonadota bacterium]